MTNFLKKVKTKEEFLTLYFLNGHKIRFIKCQIILNLKKKQVNYLRQIRITYCNKDKKIMAYL